MKITVSWDVLPCSLVVTCSGGPAASLLNVKKSNIKKLYEHKDRVERDKAVGEPMVKHQKLGGWDN